MPDQPYSNRELDSKFSGIADRIDESRNAMIDRLADFETSASAALTEIKEQTTKTNGRVTKLEKDLTGQDTANQVFRARIYTAVSICVFLLGTILVPIAAAYVSSGRI